MATYPNLEGINGHNGPRAQNIAWVRDDLRQFLRQRIESKQARMSDVLTGYKYLLAIEGIYVDGRIQPPKKAKSKPKKKPTPIKAPGLMNAI